MEKKDVAPGGRENSKGNLIWITAVVAVLPIILEPLEYVVEALLWAESRIKAFKNRGMFTRQK